ncbi:MAG TPA: SCP2 sterol-binding domain-containing protein [Solirubrobacteraceae bacterium]|nr:SCP2 sterol-binding domain-containing protein [Solirubrobacteraceae bacterium]
MSFEVDPAAFARAVADTPDEALAEGMASENRSLILDEIFAQMEQRFDAARGGDVDAVIDWKILDRPEGGYDHYRVTLAGGDCKVEKDPPEGVSPRVTFRVKPVTFLRLVTGNASGPQLFLTGKLKIDGDLMFAARIQSLFEIPQG